MEKAILFSFIYGQEKRTFTLNFHPKYQQIRNIITQQYPSLSNRQFSVGYKDNTGEFCLAKNDSDLEQAYRFSQNEITLYLTSDDENDDSVLGNMDSFLNRLSGITNEFNISIKQKYQRTVKDKLQERERRQQYYSQVLENERTKTGQLENELKTLLESVNSINAECNTCRESLKFLVSQYQNRMNEATELKKDRDEKVMLEAKVKQLQKELNEKIQENTKMTQSIRDLTTQRDHFNKKAEELENHQQNLETDYLHQSIKFTSSMNSPPNNPQLNASVHHASPFAIPPDISAVDIQVLLSLGVKLDTQTEQQKVFDIIRQKKDITKVMEALIS